MRLTHPDKNQDHVQKDELLIIFELVQKAGEVFQDVKLRSRWLAHQKWLDDRAREANAKVRDEALAKLAQQQIEHSKLSQMNKDGEAGTRTESPPSALFSKEMHTDAS